MAFGPGVTLGAVALANCPAQLDCPVTALTHFEGATCDIGAVQLSRSV